MLLVFNQQPGCLLRADSQPDKSCLDGEQVSGLFISHLTPGPVHCGGDPRCVAQTPPR